MGKPVPWEGVGVLNRLFLKDLKRATGQPCLKCIQSVVNLATADVIYMGGQTRASLASLLDSASPSHSL